MTESTRTAVGRRRGRTRAVLAAFLAAAGFASFAGGAAAADPPVPEGLLTDFAKVGEKLDELIADTKAEKGNDAARGVVRAERAKHEFVRRWYGEFAAFGVSYALVFVDFDCVDRNLDSVRLGLRGDRDLERLKAKLGDAKDCAKHLKGKLEDPGPAVEHKFEKLIEALEKLKDDVATITRDDIDRAEGRKYSLISRHFHDLVYGVPFDSAFTDLDCIDRHLKLGEHQLRDEDFEAALHKFKIARECAQRLEKKYKAVGGG
jgi:hypothetical protein